MAGADAEMAKAAAQIAGAARDEVVHEERFCIDLTGFSHNCLIPHILSRVGVFCISTVSADSVRILRLFVRRCSFETLSEY
jgi:hypothetical protein